MNSFGEDVLSEAIFVMFGSEMLSQPCKQIHVLGKVGGNVRFHDFEIPAFSLTPLPVVPREAHHCADACFAEYFGLDFNRVTFKTRPQVLQDNGPDFFGSHIAKCRFLTV